MAGGAIHPKTEKKKPRRGLSELREAQQTPEEQLGSVALRKDKTGLAQIQANVTKSWPRGIC